MPRHILIKLTKIKHKERILEAAREKQQVTYKETKIMASGPITSWQIDGERVETVETVADFIFWGSKITAGGDCSYEIKRR